MAKKRTEEKPVGTRPRKPLSEEDKITIALARFAPGGRSASIDELADRFKRHRSVVSRAISEAMLEGLVELRRTLKTTERVVRDQWTEQRILNEFPSLELAIVVDSSDDDVSANPFGGDRVHDALGRALAEVIAGGIFRGGDVIGFGSGRGVYATVSAMATFTPLRVSDVRLVSLTGDVYTTHHLSGGNLMLEADDHVNLFAKCFAPKVKVRLVRLSARIAYEDDTTLQAVRKSTWLNPTSKRPLPLTHAVIGVGVLGPGHRFYQDVKGPSDGDDFEGELPESLRRELKKLVDRSDAVRRRYPNYYPVADVCNSLFAVERTGQSGRPDDAMTHLEEQIAVVNGKLLNIKPDALKKVPFLILVAGTPSKASAIGQLLRDDAYSIKILCTDKVTARTILDGH